MSKVLQEFLTKELQNLEAAGLFQSGAALSSPQGGRVQIGVRELINFASDNYLGWTHDPELIQAASTALQQFGTGWASGRILSGTHELHRSLEILLSKFLGTEESLIFPTGYQANLGIFECLFTDQDYLFCDYSLHPSSVDGIRLSLARQLSFKTQDLTDLEDKLKRSPNARFRAIITEAVASPDGRLAPLPEIVRLAEKYDAIVSVDDAHGIGVLGVTGRGVSEHYSLHGQIDLLTGTFGHALGGVSIGYVSGRKDIISWLRQKSRTYLFSGTPTPASLAVGVKAIERLQKGTPEVAQLREKTGYFRSALADRGFELVPAPHPIVSIIVRDAVVAQKFANRLYQAGLYVIGLCFPVVPRGSARIRAQISAAHTQTDLDDAITAFQEAGQNLRLLR